MKLIIHKGEPPELYDMETASISTASGDSLISNNSEEREDEEE